MDDGRRTIPKTGLDAFWSRALEQVLEEHCAIVVCHRLLDPGAPGRANFLKRTDYRNRLLKCMS